MMYIVRFVRRDGKPDEEYYYNTQDHAVSHFCLFHDDDSGLYKTILLLAYEEKMIKTIAKHEF